MPDASHHILDLISGYLLGELDAGQKQELDHWVRSSSHNRMLFDQLTDPAGIKNDLLQMGSIDGQPVWDLIRQKIPGLPADFKDTSPRRLKIRSRYRWAAAILLVILSGAALRLLRPQKDQAPPVAGAKNCNCAAAFGSFLVDRTKVNLILANGTVIKLDEQRLGTQWQRDSMIITRNDSSIEYRAVGEKRYPLAAVQYNTLVTPPGRSYLIHLADGSDAWLSAGSSLKYPVPFDPNERRVELAGEAFFTIKPAKDQPFMVLAKGTVSLVRGTSFNVRAYPAEEGVKTTVEKGKVTVKIDKDSVVVSAGEEARLTAANGWQVSKLTNAANAGNWRSGVLEFDKISLEEVLPQVTEWYAYRTEWQPGASSIELMTGRLNINEPITNVVKVIEKNFMVRIEVDTTNKILRIYK